MRLARHKPDARRAFTLVELLVVVLCAALVAGPLLACLARAGALQQEISRQGGDEAWSAFQRRVVGQGVDPCAAAALTMENPVVSGRAPLRVSTGTSLQGQGMACRVTLLLGGAVQGVAESGGRAAGLELRAGPAVLTVDGPEAPARERTLRPPRVSPSSGSVLAASRFVAAPLQVRVSSPDGALVCLSLQRPSLAGRWPLERRFALEAREVVEGVAGELWVEHDGVAGSGALMNEMADGRRIWFVEENGEVVRYNPSAKLSLHYRLDVGEPVLLVGAAEHAAGSAVDLDFYDVMRGRGQPDYLRVSWSRDTEQLLQRGALPGLGLGASFHGLQAGGGSLGPLLFSSESLGLWSDQETVRAWIMAPETIRSRAAQWLLRRRVVGLPEPLLSGGPYDPSNPLVPGRVEFRRGTMQGIGEVGRLSARGGRLLSLGGTLGVEVIP